MPLNQTAAVPDGTAIPGQASAGITLPASVSEAVYAAVREVLSHGEAVSNDAGKSWLEVFHFSTGMSFPCRRIFVPSAGRFDLIGAAARFIWMFRGDEAASTITYYVPKAGNYSADGIALPGSNYGHRLRRSLPGVDQVTGVIERIRQQPETRQAATVIWNPLDAVRKPFDIPCAFGTLYHLRAGGLAATTIMRSNKPLTLMPFNFFEFSMLAEIVAAEVNAPLTSYHHWAGALQVPFTDCERAEHFLAQGASSAEMPAMPRKASAVQQATTVCLAEERLRCACDRAELDRILAEASENLHEYWNAFVLLLSLRWFIVRGDFAGARAVCSKLPDYFAGSAESSVAAAELAAAGGFTAGAGRS